MNIHIFARAILINQHGKFLIVKNLARDRYEFPGGKQDLGETSLECAFRELKEEIGVTATAARFVGQRSIAVDSVLWRGDFWRISDYTGRPRVMEKTKLGDLRWVTIDELAGLPQIPRVCIDVAREAGRQGGNKPTKRQGLRGTSFEEGFTNLEKGF